MIFACGKDNSGVESVFAFLNDGTLSWNYTTGGIIYGIVTDSLNNVYVVGEAADNGDGHGTRNIWKLNSAGTFLVGSYVLAASNLFDIDIDDNYLYMSGNGGAIRTNHSLANPSTITGGSAARQAIRVDGDGNIYLGGGGLAATLTKYNSSLVSQWTEDTNDSVYSIDILSNGDVIACAGDEIRYYKSDGSSANGGTWAVSPDGATYRVAVDSNDNIYAVRWNDNTGSQKRFISLDTDGNENWSITTDAGDLENIYVNSDDEVFVCGDIVNGHNIWSVNLTTHTLTNLANTADEPVYDLCGDGIAGQSFPLSKNYTKYLYAIGNNQVWYESSAGTMSVLDAATEDIDTSKLLSAFEAYGKIFIANESDKKVIDFTNIKIATADLGSNPPDFGTVLTGGTSGAVMVVDYITTLSGACTLYGKRTSTATFSSGETVTGTDDDGNTVSFTTSAAETAPPHWYDWTVYGNDASYGVMPTKVRWGCLYRGRAMLTDDPDNPHQWYLSRQFNPWDWLYAQNDAQSPVAGNDADAGKIGDVTISAIPYSDDYMVICGANNLYYMLGDPAMGGQIIELSLTDGIVAPSAFCWDGKKNLYILGTNGILRIPPGFGPPENLSEFIYPDFIKDLDFNPSLHRITMGFDRTDKGLLITKTTLDGGANSNWWFDLRTEGLFPESYPDDCGVFSIFHYDSTNPDYRKFIVGCNDGYLRTFDVATKNDTTTDSLDAIDSYFSTQPILLSQNPHRDGFIGNIDGITAGGVSNGSESDSDDISIRVFVAKSAEGVIEEISANNNPRFTQVITAPGRKKGNLSRKKTRGRWAGLRIGNDTAGESWGLERIVADVKEKGRMA
ncbi:MAG: hypothetical protein JRJ62_12080 [Deltaproteobacteria bacterium]|nr:hypothetical protein [Deltaproteobacteria bacterium]